MAEGLSGRMLMEHRDEAGDSVFTSRAWRRMFDIKGPLVELGGVMSGKFISLGITQEEEMRRAGFGLWFTSAESARNRSSDLGDLRNYWMGILSAGDFLGTAPSYTLNRDLILRLCHRLFAARRKSGAHISGGQFVARLAEHFGLLTAWVAVGPERQPVAAAGAPAVAEDASIIDEGGQADPEPKQAPQQPPPPPPAHAKTMP
ncbi:hypothetical protein Tco_0598877 [Tanacetum coccineum]